MHFNVSPPVVDGGEPWKCELCSCNLRLIRVATKLSVVWINCWSAEYCCNDGKNKRNIVEIWKMKMNNFRKDANKRLKLDCDHYHTKYNCRFWCFRFSNRPQSFSYSTWIIQWIQWNLLNNLRENNISILRQIGITYRKHRIDFTFNIKKMLLLHCKRKNHKQIWTLNK